MYLQGTTNRITGLVNTSNLTPTEAYIAYRFCYIPAKYAESTFLSRMGFNRHFPWAATYGPLDFGVLAFQDLSTEQGVMQIKTILENFYHGTEIGKMIMVSSLHTLQMEAGISALILTNLSQDIPYLTNCWLTSLRRFLHIHNISLEFADAWNHNLTRHQEFADAWNHNLTRHQDSFIMDKFSATKYSISELRNLNAVRLHLQVATVAKISTADGVSITKMHTTDPAQQHAHYSCQTGFVNPQSHPSR